MFKPTNDHIKRAQNIVATQQSNAAGYRIKVFALPSTSELKAGEAEKFSSLAAAGFVAQSEGKTEQETRGSNYGIVCSVGSGAYSGSLRDGGSWVKVGDVVGFNRYAGQRQEEPPGSGFYYQICNDEDPICVYSENLLTDEEREEFSHD